MKFRDVNTLSDLRSFLRNLENWLDDPGIYDHGLVILLFLDILDNLRMNLGGSVDQFGEYLDAPQREFLAKLARCANMVTDKAIEEDKD